MPSHRADLAERNLFFLKDTPIPHHREFMNSHLFYYAVATTLCTSYKLSKEEYQKREVTVRIWKDTQVYFYFLDVPFL